MHIMSSDNKKHTLSIIIKVIDNVCFLLEEGMSEPFKYNVQIDFIIGRLFHTRSLQNSFHEKVPAESGDLFHRT